MIQSVLALAGRDVFPQATEEDAAHNRSQIIQPAPPSALRRAGVTGNHASNRFFSFATDSDDDQIIFERVPTRPRRRLRLKWNSDDAQQVPVTQIDTPDSCDHRLARVRHAVQQERVVSHVRHDVRGAAQVVRSLADRVGRVCEGQDIPRAIRRQQWSAFKRANCVGPLSRGPGMRRSSVVDECWEHIESMSVAGTTMSGHDAALVGWETLSEVMREDLFRVDPQTRFPKATMWGAHLSGRVQERILTMAATVVRSSGVVGVSASATASGTELAGIVPVSFPCVAELPTPRAREVQTSQSSRLGSSPRGGEVARHCYGGHGKHFVFFFPCCCSDALRRTRGEGRVGKEELCRRCDLFAEGRWDTLLDEAVPNQKRAEPTDKQKAEVACRKVRLGEVSRARHCLTSSPLALGTDDTFRGVAELTSSTHLQRVASICPRVQSRHPSCTGPRCVLEESQDSAKKFISRSRRLHVRTFASFYGRPGHDGSLVRSGNRVGPGEPSFISIGSLSPQPD